MKKKYLNLIFTLSFFYLFSSFGIQFVLQIRNPLKKQDIPIGTIFKYHFFGLSPQGIPRHPIIDQIIDNSSSTTTLQDLLLYRIEFAGIHHPQCRICRNIHSSKEDLVIRTSGIFFPPSLSSSAGFANWIFCSNYSCIRNLIGSKGEIKDGYSSAKYLFPIFNKKLLLSSTTKQQLTFQQTKEIEQLSNGLDLQIINTQNQEILIKSPI